MQPTFKNAMLKTFATVFVLSPVLMVCMFSGLAYLEGKNKEQIKQHLRVNAWNSMKVSAVIWPVIQFVNFKLIPAHY